MKLDNGDAPSTATRACCCARRPASRTWSSSSTRGPRLARAARGRDGPDRARPSPTSTSTRSCRRWTPTRARTCSCCSAARPTASTGRGRDLGDTIRTLRADGRTLREVNGALAPRGATSAASSTTSGCWPTSSARKDDQLARFVDDSNARTRRPSPARSRASAATLRHCPGRSTETRTRWPRPDGLATSSARRSRRCGRRRARSAPTLRQVRPFLKQTTPVIRDSVRPLVRDARPVVAELRPTTRDLGAATPGLKTSFEVVNTLARRARLQPARRRRRATCSGCLGSTTLGASMFSTQDAHGPIRRGLVVTSCDALRILDNIKQVNPVLGTHRRAVELPATTAVVPGPDGRPGRDRDGHGRRDPAAARGGPADAEQASSRARIVVMVGFALSCFGLLLFLWLSFGGPIPLKPKGYRVSARSARRRRWRRRPTCGSPACPVGKVKTIDARPRQTGLSDVVMEIGPRYAPLPRDVRATLRQKTLLGETYVELTPGTPRRRGAARGRRGSRARPVAAVRAAGRDLPRVRPEDARRVPDLDAGAGRSAIGPLRARRQRRARQPRRRSREDTTELVGMLRRQQAAVQGLVSDTGTCSTRCRSATASCAGMIRELRHGVRARRAGRDRAAARGVHRAADVRARGAPRRCAAWTASPTTPTRSSPSCGRPRASCRRRCRTCRRSRPDLQALFRDLDPLITASKRGFPATERLLEELRPFLGQIHPALQQVIPILQFVAPYQREITAFFGNTVAATQARGPVGSRPRALPAHGEPAQPGDPAVVSAPDRLQPHQPVAAAGRFDQLSTGIDSFETRHCGRRADRHAARRPGAAAVLGQATMDTLGGLLQPAAGRSAVAAAVQAAGAVHVPGPLAAVPPGRRRGPSARRLVGSGSYARCGAVRAAVRAASARPGRVLAIAALVAAGALLALRLEPTAATDTLVGRGTPAYKATDRYHERFGDDAVVILVRGSLPDIVLTREPRRAARPGGLHRRQQAEGREGARRAEGRLRARSRRPSPCRWSTGPARSSTRPSTRSRSSSTRQVQAATHARAAGRRRRAARLARRRVRPRPSRTATPSRRRDLVNAQFQRDLLTLAVRYGLNRAPPIRRSTTRTSSTRSCSTPRAAPRTPKARFAYLFPNARSALIQVRLKPGLNDAQRATAIAPRPRARSR